MTIVNYYHQRFIPGGKNLTVKHTYKQNPT